MNGIGMTRVTSLHMYNIAFCRKLNKYRKRVLIAMFWFEYDNVNFIHVKVIEPLRQTFIAQLMLQKECWMLCFDLIDNVNFIWLVIPNL